MARSGPPGEAPYKKRLVRACSGEPEMRGWVYTGCWVSSPSQAVIQAHPTFLAAVDVKRRKKEEERGEVPSFVSWSRPSSCGRSWRSSGLGGGRGSAYRNSQWEDKSSRAYRLGHLLPAVFVVVLPASQNKSENYIFTWYCVYRMENVL